MPHLITSVAVFCGSNAGSGESYAAGAAALGQALGKRGITLVYGGTHKGLMGVLADACLDAGGTVHGVITERLKAKGHLHPGLTRAETVADMRARKARMGDLAEAFIGLPGGIGTLEEFMEAWTLSQLGDHSKPLGLLDIGGFYEPFFGFIEKMIAERFLPPEHRHAVVRAPDAVSLLDGLAAYEKVTVAKWL